MLAEQELAAAVFEWLQEIATISAAARRVVCKVIHGVVLETAAIPDAPADPLTPIEQILLYFPGLWSEARTSVREGSITLLFLEPDLKRDLGLKFLNLYERLRCLKDPVLEGEAYSNLSCQVFTVRSIAAWLVTEHRGLERLLELICSRFREGSLDEARRTLILDDDENMLVDETGGAYGHVLNDLRYLLECGATGVVHALPMFLELLSMMEGMDKHTRAVDDHVEFESKSWQKAIMINYHILPVLPYFIAGCDRSAEDLAHAIQLTARAIAAWGSHPLERMPERTGTATGIVGFEFDVASQPVSIQAPLERFLASLLSAAGARGMELAAVLELDAADPQKMQAQMLAVVEMPLRHFVLAAQSKCNLWVRNGYSVPSMIYYMRQWEALGGVTVDKDLIILQAGAAVLPPPSFMATLLDRYSLEDWFDPAFSAEGIDDQEEMVHLVNEFLSTLINVIGERHNTGIGTVTAQDIIRREVVHMLYEAPIPFSQFNKYLPKTILTFDGFEEIVKEVADFKQKSDGTGSHFSLKPQMATAFDPYFMHFDVKRRQSAVATAVARSKGRYMPPPPPPRWRAPFAGCSRLLLDASFLGVVYTVLARAATASMPPPLGEVAVNEGAVNQVMHILALGMLDADAAIPFGEAVAAFVTVKSGSLLGLLAKLKQNTKWSNAKGGNTYAQAVDWFVEQLRSSPSERVQEALALVSLDTEDEDAARAKRQLRKAEAKVRQAKIMARFAQKQKLFIEQASSSKKSRTTPNAAAAGPAALPSPASASTAIAREEMKCLVCLEDILAGDAEVDAEEGNEGAAGDGADADGAATFVFLQRNSALDHRAGPGEMALRACPAMSSCGHGMHYACSDQWKMSRLQGILAGQFRPLERLERTDDENAIRSIQFQDFFCPLCNDIANALIPSLPKSALVCPVVTYTSAEPSVGPDSDAMSESSQATATGSLPVAASPISRITLLEDLSALLLHSLSIQPAVDERKFVTENTIYSRASSADPILDGVGQGLDQDAMKMMSRFCKKVYLLSLRPGETGPESSNERIQRGHSNLVNLLVTTLLGATLVEQNGDGAGRGSLELGLSRSLISLGRLVKFSSARYSEKFAPDTFLNDIIGGPFDGTTKPSTCTDDDAFLLFANGLFRMYSGSTGTKFVLPWARICALIAVMKHTKHALANPAATMDQDDSFEVDALVKLMMPDDGHRLATLVMSPGGTPKTIDIGAMQQACLPTLRQIYLLVQIAKDDRSTLCDPRDFDAIVAVLGLSTLSGYLDDTGSQLHGQKVPALIQHWLGNGLDRAFVDRPGRNIVLAMPQSVTVRELVALPHEFRELFYRSVEQLCPVTQKPMVQPAICLTCGEFLCTESACCREREGQQETGACTRHTRECGEMRGMFLQIKTCKIILLEHDRGGIVDAPYVDSRGEVDPGLKRGRPLFLQPAMYARLNQLFQSQRITADIIKIVKNQYPRVDRRRWLEI